MFLAFLQHTKDRIFIFLHYYSVMFFATLQHTKDRIFIVLHFYSIQIYIVHVHCLSAVIDAIELTMKVPSITRGRSLMAKNNQRKEQKITKEKITKSNNFFFKTMR